MVLYIREQPWRRPLETGRRWRLRRDAEGGVPYSIMAYPTKICRTQTEE